MKYTLPTETPLVGNSYISDQVKYQLLGDTPFLWVVYKEEALTNIIEEKRLKVCR